MKKLIISILFVAVLNAAQPVGLRNPAFVARLTQDAAPPPSGAGFILRENGDKLLRENGDKLMREFDPVKLLRENGDFILRENGDKITKE